MRQAELRGREHMVETVQEQQTVEINKGRASGKVKSRVAARSHQAPSCNSTHPQAQHYLGRWTPLGSFLPYSCVTCQ